MSEIKNITAPTINLNGDSKENLAAQQVAILTATHTLIEAMNDAMPHGRDYQTKSEEVYQRARQEHIARFDRVAAIQNEVMAIWRAIDAQG